MSDNQQRAYPSGIDYGLTKREWFAGMALAFLATQPAMVEERRKDFDLTTVDAVADLAYEIANEMVRQGRNK